MNEELKNSNTNNIKVVALHPGVVRTELGRYMSPYLQMFLNTVGFPLVWLVSKSSW